MSHAFSSARHVVARAMRIRLKRLWTNCGASARHASTRSGDKRSPCDKRSHGNDSGRNKRSPRMTRQCLRHAFALPSIAMRRKRSPCLALPALLACHDMPCAAMPCLWSAPCALALPCAACARLWSRAPCALPVVACAPRRAPCGRVASRAPCAALPVAISPCVALILAIGYDETFHITNCYKVGDALAGFGLHERRSRARITVNAGPFQGRSSSARGVAIQFAYG